MTVRALVQSCIDDVMDFILSETNAGRDFPEPEIIRQHVGFKSSAEIFEALNRLAKDGKILRKIDDRSMSRYRLHPNKPETLADQTLQFIFDRTEMFHGFPSRLHICDEFKINGNKASTILANLKRRGDIDTQIIRKGKYKYVLTDVGRSRVQSWRISA
jgi:DNA-binding transcriptional regulator PaaX